MILNDRQIKELCSNKDRYENMIDPFMDKQSGKPSGGLGSFGYDIHLGKNMLIPCLSSKKTIVLDPLSFPKEAFDSVFTNTYYDIPPNSFILAETVEMFNIPADICGIVWGKSTYARCGLLVNVTPAEPMWKGILTMELANVGHLPIRIHVGKGIAQMVFYRGDRPDRTYTEKEAGGIYQNQNGVTVPQ